MLAVNRNYILPALALAATLNLEAQSEQRRMTPMRGGSGDQGKCTVEVVIDGAADVEIRGDTANLRNLAGASPRWRRFECTGPLPPNPGDFRFAGVDGRGRQQLVRDPRSGGAAVIRLTDPDGGSEGYTFDIFWSNARGNYGNGRDDRAPWQTSPDRDEYHRDRSDDYHRNDGRRHLFAQIREDLEHLQQVSVQDRGDQYRLARTEHELDELQEMLARGRYDTRELDDVIRSMQRVANDNRLSRRDRDLVTDDVNKLLYFREHSPEYGVR